MNVPLERGAGTKSREPRDGIFGLGLDSMGSNSMLEQSQYMFPPHFSNSYSEVKQHEKIFFVSPSALAHVFCFFFLKKQLLHRFPCHTRATPECLWECQCPLTLGER